jgi:hypothetical protein
LFRAFLSLYLILVAFIGPGLCCCALGHCHSATGEVTEEEESHSTPCCHHVKQRDSEPSSPHKHSPAPFCPCKEHQQIPVAPTVTSSTTLLLHFVLEFIGSFDLQSIASISNSFSTTALNSTCMLHLIELSAQDGLRAPVVLLC